MKQVHLIGNAHLDPVWLWTWQEGFAEIKATFRSALDRMKEFPGFVFTTACASYYKWVEENEPDMFEEIDQRVREGRWVIAGGWWLQPDCNLPNGESFVRHGLYAQRYFLEKFGRIATFGYNVDSFGHNGMLPQILKKSGMENYVMMRPERHEKELPANVFWWESPDGSRVLTYRIPMAYGTGWSREGMVNKLDGIASLSAEQGTPMMYFYGVGNHGGGPTIASLHILEELMDERGRGRLDYSSPEEYFAELRASGASFPVVQDDLQHHASGCYSTMSEVKANNRRAECRLASAEKLMTVANRLLGLAYEDDLLSKAWQDVLFNQFHDIMGGCSIKEAYQDAAEFHGEALKIAGDLLNAAVQKLSWNIDTMGKKEIYPSKDFDWALWEQQTGGAPVVVFNPLSWDVDASVQISKKVAGLTDEQGNPLPMQLVRASQTNGGDKWDSLFRAVIPAMGYRVFRAFTQKAFGAEPDGMLACGDDWLENDWLKLAIDPATGYIASLWDKQKGVEVFAGSAAVPVVIDDAKTDTWAHAVFEFRDEAGRFGGGAVRLIEEGPLRATLRVSSIWGHSALQQDFTLYRHKPGVEVSVKLNWQEGLKMLKLSFPVNVSSPKPVYEIPYGAMERPSDGREYPGQAWVDISGSLSDGSAYGLAMANTTKYSYDSLANELRLTVVRSAIYADHFGERDSFCEYMDQGVQYLKYLLLPHEGGWQQSGIVRRTQELLNPVITVLETYHRGKLPNTGSAIQIDSENVIASVLKKAQDDDGVILRCHETLGVETQANISLTLLGVQWAAAFGPFEIKTFHIGPDGTVTQTDLIERLCGQE